MPPTHKGLLEVVSQEPREVDDVRTTRSTPLVVSYDTRRKIIYHRTENLMDSMRHAMSQVVCILQVWKAFASHIYEWKVPGKILFFIRTAQLFELVDSVICKKIDQVFDHGKYTSDL